MIDRNELKRVIWRLEQPNEVLRGSLRVDVQKAAAFLRELDLELEKVTAALIRFSP